MTPEKFFLEPAVLAQKQYEALRLYFIEKKPAREVAMQFGYTYRGFTTLVSDFGGKLKKEDTHDYYFVERKKGKKRSERTERPDGSLLTLERSIIQSRISSLLWTVGDLMPVAYYAEARDRPGYKTVTISLDKRHQQFKFDPVICGVKSFQCTALLSRQSVVHGQGHGIVRWFECTSQGCLVYLLFPPGNHSNEPGVFESPAPDMAFCRTSG